MSEIFVFVARYFWLFSSITLVLIGDILFIIKSIQDMEETIVIYRRHNKDKKYLKGKFLPIIICLICNIVIALIIASLIFYAKEVIDMRNIINAL